MANPELILCDSDVLTQFFICNEVRPLKILKDGYGIQPTVVQEVDLELRWIRKHKDKFVPQLDKALKSSLLAILDPSYFQSLLGTAPVGSSWAAFQSLGAQYEGHIHRGEAYTFAAAVTLGLPALSNDFNAIKTLETNFLTLPTPVLRCFDLLAFCFQSGALPIAACESVRSELLKNGEGLPKAFMNSSFENGLNFFPPRLREGVAMSTNQAAGYSVPLFVSKVP